MKDLKLVRRHSYFNFFNQDLIKIIIEYLDIDEVVYLAETCYTLYSMIRNDNYYWYVKYSQKKYKNYPYQYVHKIEPTYSCVYLHHQYNIFCDKSYLQFMYLPIKSEHKTIIDPKKIPSNSIKYTTNWMFGCSDLYEHWDKIRNYPKKYLKEYNHEIDYYDEYRFLDYYKMIKELKNTNFPSDQIPIKQKLKNLINRHQTIATNHQEYFDKFLNLMNRYAIKLHKSEKNYHQFQRYYKKYQSNKSH